ncbi:hypothetical protein M9H77_36286 [Catharanthus roseus]|uniref:Uncharacterized protein n=1 Tax=Catharanthus roseus TaxID=4058 RepID=A0ACB9ZSN9_CATRO|nr:hypothetical protein M9H77_36286 [Catharanthus roseus]
MRQLTYGSGTEPHHRGLGQHLYNSQSSIGSGQDATYCDLAVHTKTLFIDELAAPSAYRYEILDQNFSNKKLHTLPDIHIRTWYTSPWDSGTPLEREEARFPMLVWPGRKDFEVS